MDADEIKALARILDRVDYYRLLKADRKASSADIRSAYHQARRRFHPDSFLSADDDLRRAVNEIARRITEGYMVLRDRHKRSAYNDALESGTVRYSAEIEGQAQARKKSPGGETPNGRKFYAMAQDEERRGDVAKAVGHLRMALTFEPRNEHFRRELERLAPPRRKQAK